MRAGCLLGAVVLFVAGSVGSSPVSDNALLAAPSVEDNSWDSIKTETDHLLDRQTLLSTTAVGELSSTVVPNYPGCALGYLWCSMLFHANVTAAEAARLTWSRPEDPFSEWLIDNKPTCVAHNAHHTVKCAGPVAKTLLCAGKSDNYGSALEQAIAVSEALKMSDFVHPRCPGCTIGRHVAHQNGDCLVGKGDDCPIVCDLGYAPTAGKRTCQKDGILTGAECIRSVNTDIDEFSTPTPTMTPTPTVLPKVFTPTAADVAHENWTDWQTALNERATAEYRALLTTQACIYLLDLENELQATGVDASLGVRQGLFVPARALHCAWVHEEKVSTNQERKQIVPRRGDHGPWPTIYSHSTVHVKVEGQGVVAVYLPNLHQNEHNTTRATGKDLYVALAERIGMGPDMFTIYLPNSIHPVNEDTILESTGLTYHDTLQAKIRPHLLSHGSQTQKISWDSKSHKVDLDMGPIAP